MANNRDEFAIGKIKKEIDKFSEDKLPELFSEIKQYIDAKLLAKSNEYKELAEKFLNISQNINK